MACQHYVQIDLVQNENVEALVQINKHFKAVMTTEH